MPFVVAGDLIFLLVPLPQPHPGAAAVLVDELDARHQTRLLATVRSELLPDD